MFTDDLNEISMPTGVRNSETTCNMDSFKADILLVTNCDFISDII